MRSCFYEKLNKKRAAWYDMAALKDGKTIPGHFPGSQILTGSIADKASNVSGFSQTAMSVTVYQVIIYLA